MSAPSDSDLKFLQELLTALVGSTDTGDEAGGGVTHPAELPYASMTLRFVPDGDSAAPGFARRPTETRGSAMFLASAAKRVFALVALASVVPGISTAPAAAENAGPLGQCTVSVRNPAHAGNYIWAYAPWTCSTLPADGGAKIYLKILRDGALVKQAEFWQKGPFDLTFATGVACIGGSHTYQVATHGWDSDLIQYNAHSPAVTLPC
ncbi:hypothetical protein AB0M57_24160 [Streptomyces sp. NPDC051597]|uniref:hypothetical protein n=1 Tax=Streptomyces sp. NPDC051597 TaxID=3155049 RepID=UPI00342E1B27